MILNLHIIPAKLIVYISKFTYPSIINKLSKYVTTPRLFYSLYNLKHYNTPFNLSFNSFTLAYNSHIFCKILVKTSLLNWSVFAVFCGLDNHITKIITIINEYLENFTNHKIPAIFTYNLELLQHIIKIT